MPTISEDLPRLPSLAAGARSLVLAAEARALRMIEEGAPLRAVLAHLTSTVEMLSNGQTVASVLMLDKDGLLRNGASPNLPADYLDAIDRLKPDANLGTCAAAAATGNVVVTTSFYDDHRWAELRHLPLALGFLGAWSMPIKSMAGKVLGTFGTYFREHRAPSIEEREAMDVLASVAATALDAAGRREGRATGPG